MSYQEELPEPLYHNPVIQRSFADPFVLKFDGAYFAYCTGRWDDGRVFGVLRSPDLVNWAEVGGAMAEPDDPQPFFWAPEVIYRNGTFYLYYSTGNEKLMHLRVATSDRPDGRFKDAGVRLTKEDFAIDAHVFIDDDGQRYLFYATDFLDHTHIGTGIVVDRMLDWFTLAGEARPVVRAKYDWQVYDPARREKGGVRWHTVEGPFVLRRKGRYFLMFSGGNWQMPTYGVSFALTGDLSTRGEWRQFCDGEQVKPILRTDKGHQVGPGHNSVVRGPGNRDLYCVYHYWHEGNRALAVSRMDFAGPRIFVESRPYLPRPVPLMPAPKFALKAANWSSVGEWEFASGSAVNVETSAASALRHDGLPESFICELSLSASEVVADGGKFGFRLEGGSENLGGLILCRQGDEALYEWIEGEGETASGPLTFGQGFRLDALHHITIEADYPCLSIKFDDTYLSRISTCKQPLECITFFANNAKARFSGFALTEGFEDRFDAEGGDEINLCGWKMPAADADLSIRDQELIFSNPGGKEAIITKGPAAVDFEFVANIRLKGPAEPGCSYGFVLLDDADRIIDRFEFKDNEGRTSLADGEQAELPFDFNTRMFYQFRFRKQHGRIYYDIETSPLGAKDVSAKLARMGVFSRHATVALEMVRLTKIN